MEAFYAQIDELAKLPAEEREAGERRLRERFEVERAVLVLDMSQFSLSVQRHGIVFHLCQIRRVQAIALPIVAAWRGELVKCEADNILAVFGLVGDAVGAALAIHAALAAAGSDPVLGAAPTAGIGIDYGRFLLVPGRDAFGDPVNIAHKLGEDVARAAEVLVTDAVRRRLEPSAGYAAEPIALSISGLQLDAWRIARSAAAT